MTRLNTSTRSGLLYLAIILLGLTSEVALRGQFLHPGDAEATAAALRAQPGLYRLSFLADLTMALCDVALAILLYRLFAPIDRGVALAAMIFRLVQAALIGASLIWYHAGFVLITETGEAALGLTALTIHGAGYDLGLMFFAVATALIAGLMLHADALPTRLGLALYAAAAVYALGGLIRFAWPEALPVLMPAYLIPVLAEAAFCLWLLRGSQARQVAAPPRGGALV